MVLDDVLVVVLVVLGGSVLVLVLLDVELVVVDWQPVWIVSQSSVPSSAGARHAQPGGQPKAKVVHSASATLQRWRQMPSHPVVVVVLDEVLDVGVVLEVLEVLDVLDV